MSTFSLCAADAKAVKEQFQFAYQKMFLRADVYNPTDKEVVLVVRAPEVREVTFHLKAEQLQRIKTGWMNRVSAVSFESEDLGKLQFDNLAYSPYLWGKFDSSE